MSEFLSLSISFLPDYHVSYIPRGYYYFFGVGKQCLPEGHKVSLGKPYIFHLSSHMTGL